MKRAELEKKYIVDGWYLLPRKKENEYDYQERMDDEWVHQINEIQNYIQSLIDCPQINSWRDLLEEVLNCGMSEDEQIKVLQCCTDWDMQSRCITKALEGKSPL
jgi:hypothetical protein